MVINFVGAHILFNLDVKPSDIRDYKFQLAVGKDTLMKVASALIAAGYDVKEGMMGGLNTIARNEYTKTYSIKNTNFTHLLDAIRAMSTESFDFKAGKQYRFTYSGGTRSGQKRAVVVDEVHSNHILCRDLDTDDIKNYLFTRISNVQEI